MVAVEFFGGPVDGEVRDVPAPPTPEFVIARAPGWTMGGPEPEPSSLPPMRVSLYRWSPGTAATWRGYHFEGEGLR